MHPRAARLWHHRERAAGGLPLVPTGQPPGVVSGSPCSKRAREVRAEAAEASGVRPVVAEADPPAGAALLGLLADDFQVAQALKIGASPTFISNGRRQFNAIEAGALQKQFCQDNPTVEACKSEVKVGDPAAAAAPAAACGQ